MATRKKDFKLKPEYLAIIAIVVIGVVLLYGGTSMTGKFSASGMNILTYIDWPQNNQQIAAGSTNTFGGWAGEINGKATTSVAVSIDGVAQTPIRVVRQDACDAYPKIAECRNIDCGNTKKVGYQVTWIAPLVAGSHTIKATATANGVSAPTEIKTFKVITPNCNPSWSCTAWSNCANGNQTRTCTDTNNCGTTTGKPAESQACTPPAPSCTDTDGGKVETVQGNVTTSNGTVITDYCSGSDNVIEAYCDVSGDGAWININCANSGKVCKNGACVAPIVYQPELFVDVPTANQKFANNSLVTFSGWAYDKNYKGITTIRVLVDGNEITSNRNKRADVCNAFPSENIYECKQVVTQLVGWAGNWTTPANAGAHTVKVSAIDNGGRTTEKQVNIQVG